MLKRTERQIFCYDLIIAARAQHATPPSLQALYDAWKDMFDAGTCSHEREEGAVIYRIGDMDIDVGNGVARILLRRCDTNAANAVYSHRHTGTPRIVPQQPEEGGDRAAHLVISLRNEANKPSSYLCHLEGVPGLSHRLVQATLNAVLKKAIQAQKDLFVYPDPGGARLRNGNPKTTPFTPTLELIGHPSASLIQHLEDGRLHDVRLIDQRPHSRLGGNQFLVESEKQIKIKVDPNIPSQNRVQNIISAIQSKQADYQKAKIRFTDPNGISRTIDYDIATGTPEQQIYIQSYRVTGINPPMDESSERIVPALGNNMMARVLAERV
jgi:hypothetical protein